MTQSRRSKRARVMLLGTLNHAGEALPIKLRNLSPDGALVEGDKLPTEGSEIVFERNELTIRARVAWVKGNQAGIAFAERLSAEAVLRHISTPKPQVMPEFKRPGVGTRRLSAEERLLGATWAAPENKTRD